MDFTTANWWEPWMEPLLAAFMAVLAAVVVWGCIRPPTQASASSKSEDESPSEEAPEAISAQPARAEMAELRASIGALEARVQAMKQRQELQLQMASVANSPAINAEGMTAEDVIVLARQGWAAKELARVAGLSIAEAELLTRLHGQADGDSSAD